MIMRDFEYWINHIEKQIQDMPDPNWIEFTMESWSEKEDEFDLISLGPRFDTIGSYPVGRNLFTIKLKTQVLEAKVSPESLQEALEKNAKWRKKKDILEDQLEEIRAEKKAFRSKYVN